MNIVSFGFYTFVHVTLSYGLTGENICGYNDTQIRCCRNYEENNNICVVCRPGFFGMNCLQTCGENYYGNLCTNKCDCNETQICHHVCGCLRNTNMTNDSSTTENVTSSYVAESCPTNAVLISPATSNIIFNVTPPKQDLCTTNFTLEILIGAASVTSVCFVFGIGLLYRLHWRRKKEECDIHHNVVYDLEESPRIQENPNNHEEPAEHLYRTYCYDEACYSTLGLRVNNKSVLKPCTSRQEVFNDDNVYELAYSFERQNDEESPNVFISNLSEATS